MQEANQYSFEIKMIKINEELALIVQKKLGDMHYLIKYNDKIAKNHLDQLRPNYLNSKSSHDPKDIVLEIPSNNESLRKLINHPVT